MATEHLGAAPGVNNDLVRKTDLDTGLATKQATGNYVTALTSDVTASGPGSATATIANNAVTFAKFQQIASDRLLGRDTAGTGNVETLTVGGGVEFTGTGIQTSAFTGDVTKAAGGTALTIASGAVTNSKAANMPAATIKGRALGAGAGDPTDLTEAQVIAILATAFPLGVGAWTSYTPTLVQSGAVTKTVNRAVYTQIGKIVIGQALVTVTGTGTANNQIRLGLPITAAGAGPIIGEGNVYDSSATASYQGLATMDATTYITFLATNSTAIVRVGAAGSVMTAALASGDQVSANFIYEAA